MSNSRRFGLFGWSPLRPPLLGARLIQPQDRSTTVAQLDADRGEKTADPRADRRDKVHLDALTGPR